MLLLRDGNEVVSHNLSPLISIMAIVLLIVTVAGAIGRIFTKVAVVRALSLDDYAILGAALFCTGQTASILVASANGLGKDWTVLNGSQRETFAKALYASGLLFILSTVFAKLSVVLFIGNLAPIAALSKVGHYLGALFVLWGVASLLAAAFQCRVPHVWNYADNVCYDIHAFWISFDSISIIIEVILTVWPIIIVSRLHATRHRRAIFIACFAVRAFVIGATIAQIFYTSLNRSAYGSSPSFDLWTIILSEQIVQCVSILTACVPQIRPFLIAMESGFLTARADERRKQSTKNSKSNGSSTNPSDRSSKSRWKLTSRNNSLSTAGALEEGIRRPSSVALLPISSGGNAAWRLTNDQNVAGEEPKPVETSRLQLEGY